MQDKSTSTRLTVTFAQRQTKDIKCPVITRAFCPVPHLLCRFLGTELLLRMKAQHATVTAPAAGSCCNFARRLSQAQALLAAPSTAATNVPVARAARTAASAHCICHTRPSRCPAHISHRHKVVAAAHPVAAAVAHSQSKLAIWAAPTASSW